MSVLSRLPRATFVASLLSAICAQASAQKALVTFYSHGSNLTSGIPGTHHDMYFGSVFDGSQGLFSFRDGFFEHNNRYLVLRLDPGPHTFGASNGKRPEPRETLSLDLKAGESYFIRAQGESKGVPGIFTLQHGRLDLMPCTEAAAELTKAKPLKDKALWKFARKQKASLVEDAASPPPCN